MRVGEREPVRRRSNGFAAEGGANAHHRQDGALTDGGRESTRVLSENHAGACAKPRGCLPFVFGSTDLGQAKARPWSIKGRPPLSGRETTSLRRGKPCAQARNPRVSGRSASDFPFHFWHLGQYQLVRPPSVTLATAVPQTGHCFCA